MKKLITRKGTAMILVLGGALVGAFASGCSAGDVAPSTQEHAGEATAAETIIEASAEARAATGIAYYAIGSTGSGRIIGVGGEEMATFALQSSGGKNTFAMTVGAEQLSAEYTTVQNGDTFTVEGTMNGKPFHVSATKDGKIVEGAVMPSMSPSLQKMFAPMSKDVATYGRAHEKVGCALAGIEVLVSAFTLQPEGIAFGLAGILVAC